MATLSDIRERRAVRQQEILRRVEAGEMVADICREAGMPSHVAVCVWAKRYEWFGEALANAQQRATWRRVYGFDDARAAAFLARLAAGEGLKALLRDPAMPSRKTLDYWRATQPYFGAEVLRLVAVHRGERARRTLVPARRRAWDEKVADRILLLVGRGHSYRTLQQVDPALPSAGVIARWRCERPAFDFDMKVNVRAGRLARGKAHRAAVAERLIDGIVEGGSIASLGGTGGLPARQTLYNWVMADPAFAQAVARASADRDHLYLEQIAEIAARAAPGGVTAARRRIGPLSRRIGMLKPGRRWGA